MRQEPSEALYLYYFIWSSFLFPFPTFSASLRLLGTEYKLFPFQPFSFVQQDQRQGKNYRFDIYQFPDAFGIVFHTEDKNGVSACE